MRSQIDYSSPKTSFSGMGDTWSHNVVLYKNHLKSCRIWKILKTKTWPCHDYRECLESAMLLYINSDRSSDFIRGRTMNHGRKNKIDLFLCPVSQSLLVEGLCQYEPTDVGNGKSQFRHAISYTIYVLFTTVSCSSVAYNFPRWRVWTGSLSFISYL